MLSSLLTLTKPLTTSGPHQPDFIVCHLSSMPVCPSPPSLWLKDPWTMHHTWNSSLLVSLSLSVTEAKTTSYYKVSNITDRIYPPLPILSSSLTADFNIFYQGGSYHCRLHQIKTPYQLQLRSHHLLHHTPRTPPVPWISTLSQDFAPTTITTAITHIIITH